jgi:stathmin
MAENNLLSPLESKGGLKYELVLEKPSSDTPPKIVRPLQSPARQLSAEEIENKLKEAEERRKSFEAQKINQAKERLTHVIELRDKRNEEEVSKIETTRQSLEKKMEASKENRETLIKAIQDKQKEHVSLLSSLY